MEYICSGENRSGMLHSMESVTSNEPREKALDIISNLSAILTEIKNQVDSIDSAIYGKKVEETTAKEAPSMPPILMILRQQRDFAEDILKSIVHIREGLW